jgi:hypothetical protein
VNGEGKRSNDGKPADIELMYLIDDVFVGGQPSEDPPKAGWQVECYTNLRIGRGLTAPLIDPK